MTKTELDPLKSFSPPAQPCGVRQPNKFHHFCPSPRTLEWWCNGGAMVVDTWLQ